jgi:hypothetical protein
MPFASALTSLQRNLSLDIMSLLFHDENHIQSQYLHENYVPVVEQYLVLHAWAHKA